MNAHDAIVDAVLLALRTSPAVTAGPIDEELDPEAVAEGGTEAVSVALTDSDPVDAQMNGAPVDWRSTVTIECYAVRDKRRMALGRASRALHARVYARLMQDPSLGGAAMYLGPPRLTVDTDQADTRVGCCIATYAVLHRTGPNTLQV